MDRLAELRREVERDRKADERAARRRARVAAVRRMVRPRRWLAVPAGLALLVLPVATLLRGSTFLYSHMGWPTWTALGASALLALLLLAGYAAVLSKRLSGRARFRFVAQWIAAPLVVAYCAHALLFATRINTKTPAERAYYRALHPALRLAVSTFVIADGDLVVTDIYREPEDYVRMGLPVFESSLHFRQDDGYVHALDLRTVGRGGARNWVTAAYFRLLGFRTLRHVGTADHLHVSLPPA